MIFPEPHRVQTGYWGTAPGEPCGKFILPASVTGGRALQVIACDGEETGWEHVSVSVIDQPTRCPGWPEMCAVKDLFWPPEEPVMQLHPAESDYVNLHQGCLHLWRPTHTSIPLPPSILVGPDSAIKKAS